MNGYFENLFDFQWKNIEISKIRKIRNLELKIFKKVSILFTYKMANIKFNDLGQTVQTCFSVGTNLINLFK